MIRRVVGAVLWFYFAWYALALASAVSVPLPEGLPPLVAALIGVAVGIDPARRIWRIT